MPKATSKENPKKNKYTMKMEKATKNETDKIKKKEWRKGNKEIIKSITWPDPAQAIKYTILCGIASVAVSSVIYLYQYGISEIVSKLL